MKDRMSHWLNIAVFVAAFFFIADGWRQSVETNRFIERIMHAVEDGDE